MTKSLESSESIDLERLLMEKGSLHQQSDIAARMEGTLSDALFVVRTELGMNVGFVSRFSAGRRVFIAVDSSDEEPVLKVGDSDPLESSYCQRVVDGRFPGLIDDALTFPPARKLPVTEALPVRAHASSPVCLSDGSVYGTFCCFSTEAGKAFDQKDLSMLSVFAQFTGKQIERARHQYQTSTELSGQIRSIIDDGHMHPVYQPIFNIRDKRITGYEALTRFDIEPYRPPNIWFAAAQAVGLQAELEIAAINAALKCLDRIPEDCYVSVNVSPDTLSHPTFFDHLVHYPFDRLLIEITEHAPVSDYELFNDQLNQLRGRGIKLAIDDVGAGYSSLRHILELKPQIIKLDRSLITKIDKRFDLRSMTKALIGFATDMGIKIVAEGIETIDELILLDKLGVNKAQGYLLGRPVPIEQLKRN